MQIVAFLTCWSSGWEGAGAQLPGPPVSRLLKARTSSRVDSTSKPEALLLPCVWDILR